MARKFSRSERKLQHGYPKPGRTLKMCRQFNDQRVAVDDLIMNASHPSERRLWANLQLQNFMVGLIRPEQNLKET